MDVLVFSLLLTPSQYERLLPGIQMTVQLLGLAFALGIVLSLLVGVARLSENRIVRGAALMFVEFARGISSIILLFIFAYAIPILFDVPQRGLVLLASTALGINMGGYGAEIIRGAILSVPRGQTEAAIALNLTNAQRLRHVVLPQALRVILPPMGNLTIEILKGTALVLLVGLNDILGVISLLDRPGSPTTRPVLYLNALLIYFVLAQIINGSFRLAEARVERRFQTRSGGPDLGALDPVAMAK